MQMRNLVDAIVKLSFGLCSQLLRSALDNCVLHCSHRIFFRLWFLNMQKRSVFEPNRIKGQWLVREHSNKACSIGMYKTMYSQLRRVIVWLQCRAISRYNIVRVANV